MAPGPGHCDPLCEGAPLLPKLQGYFAEFLRESCLAPLGILYLPTGVDFGYRFQLLKEFVLNARRGRLFQLADSKYFTLFLANILVSPGF
ncbi:hypothetical protein HN51_070312 [Arachis hypogaea]|uniref:Uncharacterized protein n=1 Tax=Arachis hypogaea TaxID=3818 RepID=A0A444Z2W3_ARAHY|nr:hypothetical protein Ahy_B05g076079 [Arachis hypogaea]